MATISTVKTSSILGTVVATTSATIGTDQTFNPIGIRTDGVVEYEDRASGIAVVYPRLLLNIRKANKATPFNKTRVTLILPTADITSPSTGSGIQPAPSKAYDTVVEITLTQHERGTRAERLAAVSRAASLFFATVMASDGTPSDTTGSPVSAAMVDFEKPYG